MGIARVHYCFDYILIDLSHLDFRRLDYKDIWTTAIGPPGHLDYHDLDYNPNRLQCHLDCIHIDRLDYAMYFLLKRL